MYAWTDPTRRDVPILLAIRMANTLGRLVRVVRVVVVRIGVMRVAGVVVTRSRGGGGVHTYVQRQTWYSVKPGFK